MVKDWYKTLVDKLETATSVICLLSRRSLNSPWIWVEACVTMAKSDKMLCGITLGIPLEKVAKGPLANLQNCDCNNEDVLSKSVTQLMEENTAFSPKVYKVNTSVKKFKDNIKPVLEKIERVFYEKEEQLTKFEEINMEIERTIAL